MEVELDQFSQLGLDGILVAGLFEITQTAGVVDGLHLLLGVKTLLSNAEAGVADIRGHDFDFPGRRNQRFRRWHFERKRIAQIVVSERITDQTRNGVRFLSGGATGGPHAKSVVAAFLLVMEQTFLNGLSEQVEVRLDARETGFVYGEIFEQHIWFGAATPAHQQAVATGSATSSRRLYSGRCRSFEMSKRMMRRPLSLLTPVT